MRLINTSTRDFEEFLGRNIPKYAILSHTWEEEEVSYDDYMAGKHLKYDMKGFAKIDKTCHLAAEEGIRYAWVDTCCIDKRSSAELTEAINSMFRWYERAEVCYAFLSDVEGPGFVDTALQACRWFRRGWTLQELIAPRKLKFFNLTWAWIGDKDSAYLRIGEISGIPPGILCKRDDLAMVPVAQKMSWAANRVTTRIEDNAYCLLPLMYGEEEKAFRRLQEEIIKYTPDLSIFAWMAPYQHPAPDQNNPLHSGILAEAPSYFSWCDASLQQIRTPKIELSMTNNSVKAHVALHACPAPNGSGLRYVLPIYIRFRGRTSLGILLRKVGDDQFLRCDPWNIYDMDLTPLFKLRRDQHHLLLRAPRAPTLWAHRHLRHMPSSCITEAYVLRLRAKTIRFKFDSNVQLQNTFPRSRFDEELRMFFVSDKDDDHNDWGIIKLSVQPELPGNEHTPSPIECIFCTTSWGLLSAPQCSLIPFGQYAQQINDLRSEILVGDPGTGEIIHALVEKSIPRISPAVVRIAGTPYIAIITFACLESKARTHRLAQCSAWNVYISCSVQRKDELSVTQQVEDWSMPVY